MSTSRSKRAAIATLSRHRARNAAAIAAALVGLLTLWITIWGSTPFDRRILVEVHELVGTTLDGTARGWARTATAWVLVPIACAAVALLAARRRWRAFGFVVVAAATVWALNPLIKRVVARDRPRVREVAESVSEHSFPAGHATAAMAAAIVLVVLTRSERRRVAIWITGFYVASVATSQLVLSVHYPSDLVAGCALAAAVLGLAWWLLHPRVKQPMS